MALLMLTWDFPAAGQMQDYNEKGKEWVATILRQPGATQFRGFRNPFRTTPMAMIQIEFDNIESCLDFIESEDYANIATEMCDLGVSGISAQLWGASPTVPNLLKLSND